MPLAGWWTRASDDDPWRDRRALLALVPLAIFFLAVIVWCPWYSNLGPDTLTEFAQIRAVADHGTLAWDNGPVRDFPELRTRWLIHAHGRAWGIVPPLMAYLFALPTRLGGFQGAVRFLWLLVFATAVVVYAMVYRLTRRPGVAVGSAYALSFGTSVLYWCTATVQLVPPAVLGTFAVYAGARAPAQRTTARELGLCALSGAFSSLALGCHLIWSAPLAALGVALMLEGRPWQRLARPAAYGVGALPALLAIAVINKTRFNSWSPVSYGPCTSSTCTPAAGTGNAQSAGAFVEVLLPIAPYLLALAVALWLVRRSPRATVLVALLGACALFVPETALRDKLMRWVRAWWGFFVDLGYMDLGFPFGRPPGGVGNYSARDGGHELMCVRALLQCSPFLLLATLVRRPPRDGTPARESARLMVAMLFAVVLAVALVLSMRANLEGPDIWGWPILNPRYNVPLIPAATALAFVAIAGVPIGRYHAAIAVAVGLAGAVWLGRTPDDSDLLRRQLTHWLPLVLAGAALVLVAAARGRSLAGGAAALAVALALGYSAASFFGIDVVTGLRWRGIQDRRTRELAACAPARFILLGGYATDEVMALHDRRDIMLINVGMGPRNGAGARALLDRFMTPSRPAFLIQDGDDTPWRFDWPGYEFRPCPSAPHRVYQIVRTSPPAGGEP